MVLTEEEMQVMKPRTAEERSIIEQVEKEYPDYAKTIKEMKKKRITEISFNTDSLPSTDHVILGLLVKYAELVGMGVIYIPSKHT